MFDFSLVSESCENEDKKMNVTDSGGDTCEDFYDYHPDQCGLNDDDDFKAFELCCICKRAGSLLMKYS